MDDVPKNLNRLSKNPFFIATACLFFIIISGFIIIILSGETTARTLESIRRNIINTTNYLTESPNTRRQIQTTKILGATTEANVSLFVYPKGTVSSVNVNGKIVTKSPIKYIFTSEENSNIISKITPQTPGFIVSKKELEAFLVYTAGRLNLSEAESGELTREAADAADQKETDFVSLRYIDQKTLDSIHPLSISPRPQNVSRIF